MSTVSPDMTVGEIAARFPASVRVFEKHQIDFCCGGKTSVGQACRALGLDPAAVVREIELGSGTRSGTLPGQNRQSGALSGLIDHITGVHHQYLKAQLPRLPTMLERILSKHSTRHGDVLRPVSATFHEMSRELGAHLMKEEMVLFPLIRRGEMASEGGSPLPPSHCGSVQNPIRVMVMEHDSAGEALARLRELTSGYTAPQDACNTFRAFYYELSELERDLHVHIHLENNILFPRAIELERALAA